MTNPHYFDANPLVSCADALASSPAQYDVAVAHVVVPLIEGPATTAISEVTLLEVHSKICDHWRDTGRPGFDEAWASAAIAQLMGWLAGGVLDVLSQPPKLAEMAMVNVEEITRRAGIQLRAWDAAHLLHAVSWSRTVGEKVTLVTADRRLANALAAIPELAAYVEILDPSP